MKTLLALGLFASIGLTVWAAEPVSQKNAAAPKNLASPTYRAPAQAATSQELTKREVKKLIRAARTRADHLAIAGYYRTETVKLNAQALAFGAAADDYRANRLAKNMMALTAPARFEYSATLLREEAQRNRALAASHEEMARNAAVQATR